MLAPLCTAITKNKCTCLYSATIYDKIIPMVSLVSEYSLLSEYNAIFEIGIVYLLKITSTSISQMVKPTFGILFLFLGSNQMEKYIVYVVLLNLHGVRKDQNLRMLILNSRDSCPKKSSDLFIFYFQ